MEIEGRHPPRLMMTDGSGLTGNFTLVELYSSSGVSSSSCSSPSVVKYFITAIAQARIPSVSVAASA